ncbi:hypothetical protein BKP37_14795 [Anaerobacillus alkalilacustris]|uniref:Peptidase M14 domain-containing protein n=1 Tax=Anaerobacillus alkalilacustris TaxID=393763 RepID=A0A1S2LHK4_9BACI|nr:S8 family serine peptidase [Anaerobacillus alkalilacustris]OIJ11710.1 hypothetical protein BKP37_14795 [Anaerobacillus alkalilacustris]
MKRILLLTTLLILFLVPTIEAEDLSQRVIITFKDEVDETLVTDLNGSVEKKYDHIQAVIGELPTSVIEELEKNDHVLSIEVDHVFSILGQTIDWGVERVKAPLAWENNLTGAGVKVAILDTGIANHPDLTIAGGVSIISDSYLDDNGHGTHVAGIIGAKNNLIGTVGIAPNANLYAVKVLNQNGVGFLSDIVSGIDWSISNNMDIINLSLGNSEDSPTLNNAVDTAYENGILVVAAAGNKGTSAGSGNTVEYPARYESVIAVSATNSNNVRGNFSATGPSVEIAAPGVNIFSTHLNSGYGTNSGTSMAAAHVSGVLALMKEAHPTLSNIQLREKLRDTALDIGTAGRDQFHGYGLVQYVDDQRVNEANAYYEQAMNEENLSIRLQLLIEGYNTYPTMTIFQDGISQTLELLFEYSTNHHRQGNYDLATEGYNEILMAPVIDNHIKTATIYNRSYALQEKRTPEMYYSYASNQFHFHDRIALFVEGFSLYDEAEREKGRFQEGLNHSAQLLLNWATRKQREGDHVVAIDRYERILTTPFISLNIKEASESHHRTALVEHALKQFHFHDRLALSIDGYHKYPSDTRFREAINTSANHLINWSIARHRDGDYETALDRYHLILSAPVLANHIRSLAIYHQGYAQQEKRTPEQYYQFAISRFHFTDRIDLFTQGFSIYSVSERNTGRLQEGLNQSAQALLSWANRKRQEGDNATAINSYEFILSARYVAANIKQAAESNYKTALYDHAMKQFHFHDRLTLAIEAYNKYPNDTRFREAIDTSAQHLLNWAEAKHREGNYDMAIDRYNRILSAPTLAKNIETQAAHNRLYAQQRKLTPQLYYDFSIGQFHFHDRIAKFTEGFQLYNLAEQIQGKFEEGLNASAQALLNWASAQHRNGNFGVAIDRYKLIINTPKVSNLIKNTAKQNLLLAEQGIALHQPKRIVNAKVQNYTFAQMEKDLAQLQAMYPNFMETRVIGKSLDGRDIYAVKLGHGKTEVFFNAASHAREHMTTNVLMKMIDEYAYAYAKGNHYGGFNVRNVLNNTSIWFVPMWNPDGVTLVQQGPGAIRSAPLRQNAININGGSTNFNSWKANIRGVDINRQFPALWDTITNNPGGPSRENYKGPRPLSEPESLAVYTFVLSKNFQTAISYHSSGEVIFTRNPGHVAQIVSQKTNYPIVNLTWSNSGGGFSDWFVLEQKKPGLTPEISPHVGPRPVPVANWDRVWNQNNTVGLIVADEAYRNKTLKR